MATKPNNDVSAYAKLYAEADAETRTILSDVPNIQDLKRSVEERLATVIARMRKTITKETTSKSTGKTVTVPVWDGRSPAYREWYKDHFLPILEEMVTDSRLRSLIRSNVQNLVQAMVKKEATPAEKRHLGLTAAAKGNGKGNGSGKGTGKSNDADASNGSDIRTVVDYPMVQDAASVDVLLAMIVDLVKHTEARATERAEKIAKGEKERSLTLSKAAMDGLLRIRTTVDPKGTAPAAPRKRQTASKTA